MEPEAVKETQEALDQIVSNIIQLRAKIAQMKEANLRAAEAAEDIEMAPISKAARQREAIDRVLAVMDRQDKRHGLGKLQQHSDLEKGREDALAQTSASAKQLAEAEASRDADWRKKQRKEEDLQKIRAMTDKRNSDIKKDALSSWKNVHGDRMANKQQEKEDEELAREIERTRGHPRTRQQSRKVKFEEEESEVEEATSRKPPPKKSVAKTTTKQVAEPEEESEEGSEDVDEDRNIIVAKYVKEVDKVMQEHNSYTKKFDEIAKLVESNKEKREKGIIVGKETRQAFLAAKQHIRQANENKLRHLQRIENLLGKMDPATKVRNLSFGKSQPKKGAEAVRLKTVLGKVQLEITNVKSLLHSDE